LQRASPHNLQPARSASARPAAEMLEARIIKALGTLALLVMEDAVYIPVFERLEQELADLRSRNDVIERARQFLATNHQNAMR
jgi:hypothetical protein